MYVRCKGKSCPTPKYIFSATSIPTSLNATALHHRAPLNPYIYNIKGRVLAFNPYHHSYCSTPSTVSTMKLQYLAVFALFLGVFAAPQDGGEDQDDPEV
jgi:hypothetical protein